MAHAADLPRQLVLFLLNLLGVPAQNLRYLYTFTMLTLGPLGVYFFIKLKLLKRKGFRLPFDKNTKTFAALLGGLFYLLNLSTIQTFYVPFETFTSFFAFFPWLLLVTLNYLEQPNKRHYLNLILVYLLSTPSFYVETLFVVFSLSLIPIFIANKKKVSTLFKTSLTILFTQSFWLIPVIFFVLKNGHVGEIAKINLISTPETYARNLEFANLKNLSLLKGFLFNFTDLGINGKFTYLLLPWIQHLKNPLISLIGYLNFILILTGIYYAFKKNLKIFPVILSITFISLFFLLGGGLLINSRIPLIGELFRSPFTKFSTPLSFTFSLFFSIGCIFILDLFSFLHHRLTYIFTLFTITLSLLIFTSPAFSGQLISPSMRQSIPQEYFETFEYFENQDPNTRIANFPQHTFWGWNFYSWGYRGSGFLWYGLNQPIVDRAFDVWEQQNQNYFEEINTALYSNALKDFENTVEKYAINWILVDKFVISPQSDQDLKTQQLLRLLNDSNAFKLEKNINDNILIYKATTDKRVTNFLSTSPNQNTRTYPFNDLSLRPNTNWKKDKSSITLSVLGSDPERSGLSRGPVNEVNRGSYPNNKISLPSYTETENLVPVEISYKKLLHQILLKLTPLLPTINSITPKATPNYVYLDIPFFQSSFILKLDQEYFELVLPGELLTQPDFYPLTTTYLPTNDPVNISLYTNSPTQTVNVTNALKEAVPYQCYTNKKDRQVEKITYQNSISILGTDVVGCLSLPLPSFIPPGLISTQYTHFSSTSTPANTNITTKNFSFSTTPPQPLHAQIFPTTTRQFSPLTKEKQQLNLILEANDSKSVKEITFQNITTNFHPLLATTSFQLNYIKGQTLTGDPLDNSGSGPLGQRTEGGSVLDEFSLSLPIITSPLNITQTPNQNQLLQDAKNCNQFRSGETLKTTTTQTINYQSQDATACDSLDLRHLPHSTNYLIQIDQQHQKGLPMTVCLENHSTHRCDVFERLSEEGQTLKGDPLDNSGSGPLGQRTEGGSVLSSSHITSSIIQPIVNPQEDPGYTLHLYNQSLGKRITETDIGHISIDPIPLNFLKNISLERAEEGQTLKGLSLIEGSDPERSGSSRGPLDYQIKGGSYPNNFTSTHPVEFLYTVSTSPEDSILNLYQTHSPYWIAIETNQKNINLSTWQLILRTPLLYLKDTKLSPSNNTWHNSWSLSEKEQHLILVYLPQYLEFIGFLLLLGIPIIFILHKKKKK